MHDKVNHSKPVEVLGRLIALWACVKCEIANAAGKFQNVVMESNPNLNPILHVYSAVCPNFAFPYCSITELAPSLDEDEDSIFYQSPTTRDYYKLAITANLSNSAQDVIYIL